MRKVDIFCKKKCFSSEEEGENGNKKVFRDEHVQTSCYFYYFVYEGRGKNCVAVFLCALAIHCDKVFFSMRNNIRRVSFYVIEKKYEGIGM
jgi:hypothetical protein